MAPSNRGIRDCRSRRVRPPLSKELDLCAETSVFDTFLLEKVSFAQGGSERHSPPEISGLPSCGSCRSEASAYVFWIWCGGWCEHSVYILRPKILTETTFTRSSAAALTLILRCYSCVGSLFGAIDQYTTMCLAATSHSDRSHGRSNVGIWHLASHGSSVIPGGASGRHRSRRLCDKSQQREGKHFHNLRKTFSPALIMTFAMLNRPIGFENVDVQDLSSGTIYNQSWHLERSDLYHD